MKYHFNKPSTILLLALSITSCGGGGGGGGTPEPSSPTPTPPETETSLVSDEYIANIKKELIEAGFGDFDNLTQIEIEAGLGSFDDLSKTEINNIKDALIEDTDLSNSQIEEVLAEIGIEEPIIDTIEDENITFTDNVSLANAIGIWKLPSSDPNTSGPLISLGSKSIAIYTPKNDCYDYSLYNLYANNDNDYTIKDITNDELSVITLLNNGNLLTYEGNDYEITEEVSLGLAPLCSYSTNKAVSVNIELRELSYQLKIENNSDPVSIYRWQVFFDINKSGEYDAGDITFVLSFASNNSANIPETGNFIDITSGKPILFLVYQNDDSIVDFITEKKNNDSDTTTTVVGKSSDIGTTSYSGNTLTLTFSSEINPMINLITETTPLRVMTIIRHDQNDSATYGSLTTSVDGPWHWTDYEHKDSYPEAGFALSEDGMIHTDASADQEGQAAWADIESVSINITNL